MNWCPLFDKVSSKEFGFDASGNHRHISNRFTSHSPLNPATHLSGEELLHGPLLDGTLLGDELLQGFDEGIRIAQRLGDGFLFGERRE